MDLFGKKRIRELELYNEAQQRRHVQAIRELESSIAPLRNQVEYLIRTIRQTDDIIFSISQCTNWESMRPRVAQLTEQMMARKVAESNRINSLIVGELHKTYAPPDSPLMLKKPG